VAPSVRHVRPAGRSGAVVGPRLTVSAARAADEELVIEGAIARALVIGVLQRSLEEAGRSGRQSLAECAPAAGAARPAAPRCCALARARLGAGRRGHRGGPASRTAGRRGRRAEAAPCLHERRAGTKACARAQDRCGAGCVPAAPVRAAAEPGRARARRAPPRAACIHAGAPPRAPWAPWPSPRSILLPRGGCSGACVCAACSARVIGWVGSGGGCSPSCAKPWSAGPGDSGFLGGAGTRRARRALCAPRQDWAIELVAGHADLAAAPWQGDAWRLQELVASIRCGPGRGCAARRGRFGSLERRAVWGRAAALAMGEPAGAPSRRPPRRVGSRPGARVSQAVGQPDRGTQSAVGPALVRGRGRGAPVPAHHWPGLRGAVR